MVTLFLALGTTLIFTHFLSLVYHQVAQLAQEWFGSSGQVFHQLFSSAILNNEAGFLSENLVLGPLYNPNAPPAVIQPARLDKVVWIVWAINAPHVMRTPAVETFVDCLGIGRMLGQGVLAIRHRHIVAPAPTGA
jgi:hypothetical protein